MMCGYINISNSIYNCLFLYGFSFSCDYGSKYICNTCVFRRLFLKCLNFLMKLCFNNKASEIHLLAIVNINYILRLILSSGVKL